MRRQWLEPACFSATAGSSRHGVGDGAALNTSPFSSSTNVRPVGRADIPAWRSFRRALWPEITEAENERECEWLLGDPARFAIFVSESEGTVNGFLEASLRQYAEGCETSPVGCIEGWYVDPPARRKGVGRALVIAAENWARSKGCTEMASQALLENVDGQRAHAGLGYAEVERQVCFRKGL